jgi:hypothetical protein
VAKAITVATTAMVGKTQGGRCSPPFYFGPARRYPWSPSRNEERLEHALDEPTRVLWAIPDIKI